MANENSESSDLSELEDFSASDPGASNHTDERAESASDSGKDNLALEAEDEDILDEENEFDSNVEDAEEEEYVEVTNEDDEEETDAIENNQDAAQGDDDEPNDDEPNDDEDYAAVTPRSTTSRSKRIKISAPGRKRSSNARHSSSRLSEYGNITTEAAKGSEDFEDEADEDDEHVEYYTDMTRLTDRQRARLLDDSADLEALPTGKMK